MENTLNRRSFLLLTACKWLEMIYQFGTLALLVYTLVDAVEHGRVEDEFLYFFTGILVGLYALSCFNVNLILNLSNCCGQSKWIRCDVCSDKPSTLLFVKWTFLVFFAMMVAVFTVWTRTENGQYLVGSSLLVLF